MGITVLLADDHGVLRDGLRRLLEASGDIRVVDARDRGPLAVASGGGRYLGEEVSLPSSAEVGGLSSLTQREREVLRLIVDGKSNAEAAAVLHLSPRSVETYRARMMEKLGIEDLLALVKFAIRHGITSLD